MPVFNDVADTTALKALEQCFPHPQRGANLCARFGMGPWHHSLPHAAAAGLDYSSGCEQSGACYALKA